jgi:uncharacterized protein (DUF1800 family)
MAAFFPSASHRLFKNYGRSPFTMTLMLATTSAGFRPAGRFDAAEALRPYRGGWDRRRAAHLLRRAGFGGTPAEIAAFTSLGMNAAVDRLIRFPDTSALPAAPELVDDRPRRAILAMMARLPQPAASPDPAQRAAAIKALGKAHFQNAVALMQWWLGRMIATPAPLQEKMVLFWHGHFTSAYQGKGITAADMLGQNQLFRRSALGNIRELTLAVSHDPAMLKYLDNRTNKKQHPNENYARELMELFTLGIGNYTESDVRQSARAFTGYTLDRDDRFVFNRRVHDDGIKTFLGRTGNFTGDDIVAIIFQQPAASRFFARKLLEFYLYDDPEPQLVEDFAALLRTHDFELAPVMSALLRSNIFYSNRAYRALVKSPAEFIAGTYRLLSLPPEDVPLAVLGAMTRMGQRLFFPPNVKGWDGGAAWINSGTLLARENFAAGVCSNAQMMESAAWLPKEMLDPDAVTAAIVDAVLQGDISPAARTRLQAYLDGGDVRGAVYLAMATPAYQLA